MNDIESDNKTEQSNDVESRRKEEQQGKPVKKATQRTCETWSSQAKVAIMYPLPVTIEAICNVLSKYGQFEMLPYDHYLLIHFKDRNSANAVLTEKILVGDIPLIFNKYTRSSLMLISTELKKKHYEIGYEKIKHVFSSQYTFEDQLQQFLITVQPTSKETLKEYESLITLLQKLVKAVFLNSRLYVFGSYQTGLGFKDCDLDIYVDIGEPVETGDEKTISPGALHVRTVINKVQKAINRYKGGNGMFRRVFPIRDAKVPLLKFVYIPSWISCDMSFTSKLGYYKGELLKLFLSLDNRVKPLVMIVKYWARTYELYGSQGRLVSYGLCYLVIFYLQHASVGILPTVVEMQMPQGQCPIIDGCPVNFDLSYKNSKVTNNSSIPELLGGFFKFYAQLNFNSVVICPFDGNMYDRDLLRKQDTLPKSMQAYSTYWENKKNLNLLKMDWLICVQDPIELTHNIFNHVTPNIFKRFIDLCKLGEYICNMSISTEYRYLISHLLKNNFQHSQKYNINIPVKMSSFNHVLPRLVELYNCANEQTAYCILLVNFVKDTFRRFYKLDVSHICMNIHPKQKERSKRMSPVGIQLQCVGRFYDTLIKDLDVQKLSQTTDPYEKLSELSDQLIAMCKDNGEEINFLSFDCTFEIAIDPSQLFIGVHNFCNSSIFVMFFRELKKQLWTILRCMIPHMDRYADCSETASWILSGSF